MGHTDHEIVAGMRSRNLPNRLATTLILFSSRFLHFYDDHLTTLWGAVFTCRHEEPLTLQHEEIKRGTFRSPPEIFVLAPNEPITLDGREILKRIAATGEGAP